jgi:hypothetical protein
MKPQRTLPRLVSKVVRGAHFEWQTTVKGGRALGAALMKCVHLREGGLTFFWYSAIFRFAKFVVRLQRHSGWPYVVLYLKASSVLLQQSVGGHKISNTRDLKSAVSRTAVGLPRVIPMRHRRALMSGDIWTFRIWLTLFGLYRVIEFPGTLKLNSITAPSTMDKRFLREWFGFLAAFWPVAVRLWRRDPHARGVKTLRANHVMSASKPERGTFSLPEVLLEETPLEYSERLAAQVSRGGENPSSLNLKPRLLAILKGSPNTGGTGPSILDPKIQAQPTSIGAILSDVAAWDGYKKQTGIDLLPFLQEWLILVQDSVVTRLFDLGRKAITQIQLQLRRGQYSTDFPGFGRTQGLGKLGFKVEPAGKTRVFAMVDCVTQIIMKPVHNVLFNILGTIPQDGTFNQLSPAYKLIDRIGPTGSYWSLDLSSATDRFPVLLQHAVLALLLGPRLAGLWVRLLTWREFIVPLLPEGVIPPKEGLPGAVMYGAGQPMGALTSWAAFSLTHHFLVQYAAYKAYGRLEWFELYALLGDDIVIADGKVAQAYLDLLRVIGVEFGLAKSLISHNGCFEFAKRTFIHGVNASWISLTAIGAAKADQSVLEAVLLQANLKTGWDNVAETLRVAARLLGYGYRRLASLPAVLSTRSRLQGLMVLLTRPGSPWSAGVNSWLSMVRPGQVEELPDGVRLATAEHLWQRLSDGLKSSINAHIRGITRVRLSDEYGTGATVMDPGNWHRNTWEYFILGTLLRDLKEELDAVTRGAAQLEPTGLEDADSVWSTIGAWRDRLDEIPVTPNIAERTAPRFEGRKRSQLLRLWRAIRRSQARALRKVEE